MSNERPTGLKANKGIELLTFGTPNGHKASIILEELKEAYGKDYTFQSVRYFALLRIHHFLTVFPDQYQREHSERALVHQTRP